MDELVHKYKPLLLELGEEDMERWKKEFGTDVFDAYQKFYIEGSKSNFQMLLGGYVMIEICKRSYKGLGLSMQKDVGKTLVDHTNAVEQRAAKAIELLKNKDMEGYKALGDYPTFKGEDNELRNNESKYIGISRDAINDQIELLHAVKDSGIFTNREINLLIKVTKGEDTIM